MSGENGLGVRAPVALLAGFLGAALGAAAVAFGYIVILLWLIAPFGEAITWLVVIAALAGTLPILAGLALTVLVSASVSVLILRFGGVSTAWWAIPIGAGVELALGAAIFVVDGIGSRLH
ncbi:hypothetical protein [Prosthecomicrobium hirschii]|uniref:hypothetical protein n=1 Tax=Prosthecodimorpha hirschii TaxID=665126 RepID=UPI00221F2345|nr:hypothetical protein [Prosthecomicrobium hirschii]MCW1842844.1 hypothetical protein [Prosthecomicrobium hirschii]